MKTFTQLSIGDILYIIPANVRLTDKLDYYKNVEKSNVNACSVVIKNLYLIGNGNMLINWNGNNYKTDSRHDAEIPAKDLNKNICKDEKGNIYFSNLEFFDRIKMRLILNKIKEHEQEIEKSIQSNNDQIQKIRETHFEFLNPVMCGVA